MKDIWHSHDGDTFCRIHTQCFALDRYAPKRRQILIPQNDDCNEYAVVVLLLLHVPENELNEIDGSDQTVPQRTKREVWSESWKELGKQALHTAGGMISSAWLEGWSTNEDTRSTQSRFLEEKSKQDKMT